MRDAISEWQALSALYEQAETLTAPALDAWLDRLRREDHPLVEPLQQMLGARAEVQGNGFLSALPKLTALAAPLGDDRAGERIGPYRLLAPIGSGGMAEVWRAERDDGAFRRTVAIKLLFRHMGGARGESFAQRFDRERDILASLDHPNIAGLHDAGVTPAGQPWLALEYVEGEPLIAWCDRAGLGVRGRVEVFRQVLLAVEHAHANLVIHRDLKPANILVSAAGEVRLLDFGIAKLLEAEGGVLDDTELTRHAGRLMTVAYASPEQLTGRPLTTATDVYSLGVVLYELLCGERPYEVRTDVPARLEQAILETDPRPPSRRALVEIVTDKRGTTAIALRKLLARDLDAVVLRALAKQPAQRYGSVEALRLELDRWLGGEPVDARTPSQVERLRKFVFRHPVGVSLGAAATLALFAVAGAAVALGLQAREESARATAARDFMMGMFRQADSDKSHGADMTARELLDRGRDDVLRRLKDQPALQADLLEGIGRLQSSMDELTKADVTYSELAKIYLQVNDRKKAAFALSVRADNALRMGRLDLSETLIKEAAFQGKQFRTDTALAMSLDLTRAWLALWRGDANQAKMLFARNLDRSDTEVGSLADGSLAALVGLIHSNVHLLNFDTALQLQEELARRQLLVAGKKPRDVIDLDVGRAELLYIAGRFRDAALLEERAISGCIDKLGADDASCRRLVSVGATAKLHLGRFDAVFADQSTLEKMTKDSSSPDFQASALITLIRAFSQSGLSNERPDLMQRARDLVETQAAGIDAMQRIKLLHALAEDAIRKKNLDEADELLLQAWSLRQSSGDKKPGFAPTATTQLLMAEVLLARGFTEQALTAMHEAQKGEVAVLGNNHAQTTLYSLNQVRALAVANRTHEAVELLDHAEPVLRNALGVDAPVYKRAAGLRGKLQEKNVSVENDFF